MFYITKTKYPSNNRSIIIMIVGHNNLINDNDWLSNSSGIIDNYDIWKDEFM